MFLHRIHHRLILAFVLMMASILGISGWSLHWILRQSLEDELGAKLMAMARAASVQFSDDEVGYLLSDAGPRTQNNLRKKLIKLQTQTGVQRIAFFDPEGRSLLDTDIGVERGTRDFTLRFYRREMEAIGRGESATSVLFTGIDGQPTMTGYAPLVIGDDVVGGVRVDGSATFLGSVGRMRKRLWLIGLLGTVGAAILGVMIARTITRPLHRLAKASEQIGQGDYENAIPQLEKDEIGLLARTMESMRQGVIGREQKLKAMLAGVAHEIRNPLGGITLFADLLTDEVAGQSEARQHVAKISREVDHLKKIVDSFLDYARPQAPNRQACSLSQIAQDVRHLSQAELESRNVTWQAGGEEAEQHVWADPVQLKQILLNLVRNSIAAMEPGGSITIRWKNRNSDITISVADSGYGIPEDIRDRIFDPFFTTREKGTGLGLAIVKSLVEANSGAIRLVKSGSDGTTFEIILPQLKDTSASPGNTDTFHLREVDP